MAPSSVVLPAPLGPITVAIWPFGTFERHTAHGFHLTIGNVDVGNFE